MEISFFCHRVGQCKNLIPVTHICVGDLRHHWFRQWLSKQCQVNITTNTDICQFGFPGTDWHFLEYPKFPLPKIHKKCRLFGLKVNELKYQFVCSRRKLIVYIRGV